MSAAATAQPRQTKTVKAVKPETFERRSKGFTPIPHEVIYELPRLAGGLAEYVCVQYVLSLTLGADRDPKTPPPPLSRPISAEEFAWVAHETDIRTIQYALKDLCDRKVLVREYAGRRGFYRYSAPIPTWSALPDYAEVKKKAAQAAMALDSTEPEKESEETGEETANVQRSRFRRTKVLANVPTKPIQLDDLPERMQFECSGAASIQHGIEEGLLIIKVKVLEIGEHKANSQRKQIRSNGADLGTLSKAVSNGTNGHKLPSSYDTHFRVAWAEAGLGGSDWDHEQAQAFWEKLEVAEQMVAIAGLRKQALAGDFSETAFHPHPQNFLLKKMYQRTPRGKAKTKSEMEDEMFARITGS